MLALLLHPLPCPLCFSHFLLPFLLPFLPPSSRFHSICLTSLAVIQSRTVDLPYKSWSIRPIGKNLALLTLEGQRFSIEIEIGEDWAALYGDVAPALAHLQGIRMAPGRLLLELRSCGINIMPEDIDAESCYHRTSNAPDAPASVKVVLKDLEEQLLPDIASIVPACTVASSVWNRHQPSDCIVFRIQETVGWNQAVEATYDISDWFTVKFETERKPAELKVDVPSELENGAKCVVIKASEEAKEFEGDIVSSRRVANP